MGGERESGGRERESGGGERGRVNGERVRGERKWRMGGYKEHVECHPEMVRFTLEIGQLTLT